MKNLIAGVALACAGCTLVATPDGAAEAPRPNILVIMCDDLGYADVGFNGSPDIVTPHLDELAGDGTVFTSGYVTHPFCGPSRMGFITGRSPHAIGTPYNLPPSKYGDNGRGVPEGEVLMSTALQRAGYYTGLIGKWHMGKAAPFHPNNRGFDEFYGFLGGGHSYFPDRYRPQYEQQKAAGNDNIWDYLLPVERNGSEGRETEYITDALSREAVGFVKTAAGKDEPFFLFLSYNAPHTPLEAKEEDMARFAEITDEKRRTYAGMVYAVDRGVGELVEALKATGQFGNTLIVFLSDNGGRTDQGGNNAPLKQGKGSVFEGGSRVPMFFHWPGVVPAGRRYGHPVSTLDYYPTFVRLAGSEVPSGKQLDGEDIWDDFLAGRSARPGGLIYVISHRNGYSDIGARADQWKITYVNKKSWMLFDADADPGENHDLSAKHPGIVREMVAQMERFSRDFIQPQWFHAPEAGDKWRETGMPNYDDAFAAE